MPNDTARIQAIEGRIDRQVASNIATVGGTGAFSLVPRDMGQAMEFGKLMSVSGECVRKVFRGNPGACLAIALQAWRDGADPFAYANHAYLVNDQIAFESKLVHAIVNTRAPLQKRLRVTYTGDGAARRCTVSGMLRGEDEPLEYESPKFGDITPKNSPLWKSDPDQQMHYFSVRAWARRHVPEILLGIYTPDEIEGQVIDVTADRLDAHAASMQQQTVAAPEPVQWGVTDHVGQVHEFRTVETATEACRRILIAAAAEPQALATAWENNTGLLDDLRTEGHAASADALARLYAELAPQETRPTPEPMPQEQPQEVAETAVENTPAAEPGPVSGQASVPSDQSVEGNAPARPATPAADMQRAANTEFVQQKASPPAAQTDDNHDAFWDRESLRIDPARSPQRGSTSLEWKTWPALILPKLRQVWKTPLLNAFYQHNADNLDSYGVAIGVRAKDELLAEFDAVRDRLNPAA